MRGCAPLHPTNWMSYSPVPRQGEVTTFLLGERQTMLGWRTHATHSASGRRWSFDTRKSSGSDNISGGLLFSPNWAVFSTHSLSATQVIPSLWRSSLGVPLPKVPRPSTPNDCRLISLTSLVSKLRFKWESNTTPRKLISFFFSILF